jgi:ATP-dependent Clp protease protease subunit
VQGTAADIEIQAQEILRTRQKLNEVLAHHTGQTVEKISDDVDRDRWMSPEEAVEYGLIDRVLVGRGDQEEPTDVLRKED